MAALSVPATFLAAWALALGASARPQVKTADGHVEGILEGSVRVFRGIPFAAPPIGDFRFRPPAPVKPWSGLRDASAYGDMCLQAKFPSGSSHDDAAAEVEGSEDCLYLNVYAPENASELPCLVWIHGGAYELGSSNVYNATNLADFHQRSGKPAVVVTLNYRLNVFGFLGSEHLRSRDGKGSTGNYGLQDQRAALRWVQTNIAAFGGAPDKVMIFGQSAGAGSVSAHLSMPASAGLFSRALMESGGFACWSARPLAHGEKQFQKVLEGSGCADVACLVALPADQLFAAYMTTDRCCGHVLGTPYIPWAPTIDGVELSAHPLDLAAAGKVSKVPLVIGTNADDGGTFAYNPRTPDETFRTQFVTEYGVTIGRSSATKQAAEYLQETHPTVSGKSNGWWAFDHLLTDQNFACSAHQAAEELVSKGFAVFQYWYTHPALNNKIALHSDELNYVFLNLPADTSEEEHDLAKELARFWGHHAATGSPGKAWPPRGPGADGPYLKLDVASAGGLQVIRKPYRPEQCKFMDGWLGQVLHEPLTVIV